MSKQKHHNVSQNNKLEIERTIWIRLKSDDFQIRCKQTVKSSHIISSIFSCLLYFENVNIEISEIVPQKEKCHAVHWHSLIQ